MSSVATSKPRSPAHSSISLRARRSSSESAARLTPLFAVAPISAIAIWRDQSLAPSTAAAAASASAFASIAHLPPRTVEQAAPQAKRTKSPCSPPLPADRQAVANGQHHHRHPLVALDLLVQGVDDRA